MCLGAKEDAEEQEDRTQRDRCIEVYQETLRQRNNKSSKVTLSRASVPLSHSSQCKLVALRNFAAGKMPPDGHSSSKRVRFLAAGGR